MRIRLAILVTLGAALAAALVACKEHDLVTLTDIKADVCACKTASCAVQAMTRIPKDTIKQTRSAMTLARQMMECRAKLEAAERPSTDPDAEGSAAEPGEGSAARAAGSAGAAVAPSSAK